MSRQIVQTGQRVQRLELIDGGVYMLFGRLVEARHKHTWVLYLLTDNGEFEKGDNAQISYLQRPNGRWLRYYRSTLGAQPYAGDEIYIEPSDLLYVAENVEALDFDGRFREIMAPMQWA